MRISIRSMAVAAAAALGMLGVSVGPAEAATGYDRCQSGMICLFEKANGQGTMVSYSGSRATLGDWDNRASSVYDRTGLGYTCLYSRPNFEYLDSVHDVVVTARGFGPFELAHYSDANSNLDKNLSSFRVARTMRECNSGNEWSSWWGSTWAPVPGAPALANGDLNRNGTPDLLQLNYTGSLWSLEGGKASWLGGGWEMMDSYSRHGDLDGNGTEDLVARDRNGMMWLYPGNGWGQFDARRYLGNGWDTMRRIVTSGDFDGDGRGDMIATDFGGSMWLYPGNGSGAFDQRRFMGNGWNTTDVIGAVGDFNGDGRNDIVATDTSARLWLYPGNGAGSFDARTSIGTGWGGFSSIFSIGDHTNDGKNDLLAKGSYLLNTYPGSGTGVVGAPREDSSWELCDVF